MIDPVSLWRKLMANGPDFAPDDIVRQFAAEIRADENEACAKVCEEIVTFPAGHRGQWEGYGPIHTERGGKGCATAIRARLKESK